MNRAGLIPAHAGSTLMCSMKTTSWRAHPRACGEHPTDAKAPLDVKGSSPRMRGAPLDAVYIGNDDGLIPAHAGSTCNELWCDEGLEAHPRACGEHSPARRADSTSAGSSPRMRGALLSVAEVSWSDRLIPAHAGSTPSSPASRIISRAHPRACGEHQMKKQAIPSLKAHPRACGEHESDPLGREPGEGSSPRMRGAQSAPGPYRVGGGLIPAHAGSTFFRLGLVRG